MKKTLGDYIIIILSIIASLASIIAFSKTFADKLNDQGKYGVIFLGTISIFFLSYNIYLISKYRKKVRYADVFSDLNAGFSYIHSINRMKYIDVTEITHKIIALCNSLSMSFRNVYGHHISVCIKILTTDNGRAKVLTYCRDEKSATKRLVRERDTEIDHWLSENTDFQFIYTGLSNTISNCYFFSNSLPWNYDYKNTRIKDWSPRKIAFLNFLIRQFTWPLLYKSTVVVPLVPFSINEQDEGAIRGYLCIDSPRNFVFNEQVDVDILIGVSDGLYNKIDLIYDNIKDNNFNYGNKG